MWIYSCFFLSVALFRTQFPLKKKHSLLLIWRLSCSLSGYWWPASQRNTLISGCKGTTIFLENNHSYINIYDYLTQKLLPHGATTLQTYQTESKRKRITKIVISIQKCRYRVLAISSLQIGDAAGRITTCCHICHSYPADISRNS